jgi:hypothetical protein
MTRIVRNSLVHLRDGALAISLFNRFARAVRAVGTERLRQTYQTTFWFKFGEPSCLPEEVILALRSYLPRQTRIAGVEWWLSRMYTTDVQVDFHRDRDEKLAVATGREIHPRISSLLFLNRVRGGALAVTREPPDPDNPALAPSRVDFDLVAPRSNRFVFFDGGLTHGVLDARNQIPGSRFTDRSRLRRALVMNWWHRRPQGIGVFRDASVYPELLLANRAQG